ncbi:MAG: dihydroxyacetone kinase [Mycoplasmataceae bacterium]|jgi:dihydroxyacetone kinase phosphotransfer subunit|nr:dihydroxyacetone kinase [Mycoplasmataceae bacterium]
MVNILLVSHSKALAQATVGFINEMKKGDFLFEYVAGIEDGKAFGTDPMVIRETISNLTKDRELLVIYDLGSSQMNTEMAYQMLESTVQSRTEIAKCAFLEGALVAVTSNTDEVTALQLKQIVESQAQIAK